MLNELIKTALKDGVITGVRTAANEIVTAGVVFNPEQIYILHANAVRMLDLIDMVYEKRIDSEDGDDASTDNEHGTAKS